MFEWIVVSIQYNLYDYSWRKPAGTPFYCIRNNPRTYVRENQVHLSLDDSHRKRSFKWSFRGLDARQDYLRHSTHLSDSLVLASNGANMAIVSSSFHPNFASHSRFSTKTLLWEARSPIGISKQVLHVGRRIILFWIWLHLIPYRQDKPHTRSTSPTAQLHNWEPGPIPRTLSFQPSADWQSSLWPDPRRSYYFHQLSRMVSLYVTITISSDDSTDPLLQHRSPPVTP